MGWFSQKNRRDFLSGTTKTFAAAAIASPLLSAEQVSSTSAKPESSRKERDVRKGFPKECQAEIDKIIRAIQDVPLSAQMPTDNEPPLVGQNGQKDFADTFKQHLRESGNLYGQVIVTVVRAIDNHQLKPATVVLSYGETASVIVNSTDDASQATIKLTYSGTVISYASTSPGNHGFNVTFIPFTAGGGAQLKLS